MGEMSADLVCSSSKQIKFQEAIPTCRISSCRIERDLRLRDYFIASLGFLEFGRALTRQWMVDQGFFDRWNATNDCQVSFFHRTVHEFGFKRWQDPVVFCKEQCTTRRAIQAVNGSDPGANLITQHSQGVFIFAESLPR